MKKQKGSALIVGLTILVVIIGIGLAIWSQYRSAYSYGNKSEQQLVAIRENNKNIYAQGTQKVLEIAQVPGMYKDDYAEIVKMDIEGRYGKDGLKAQMVFLKERDITLDPSMYQKIQQTIEAFRDEFKVNQTKMIDVSRSYKTALGEDYFMGKGWWLDFAGFPKVNLDEFKPITTETTETVYKNGKEAGPLKLR